MKVTASERVATRGRLLEAAKREFAERGLAGARFEEISLSAGHAKGTIYNYFASKEMLFITVVEEWCELLSAAVGEDDNCSARHRLMTIAELDVDIARKDPDLARVVVQQVPALLGSHSAAIEPAIAPALRMLGQVFDEGLRTGELSSDRPAPVLARLFLSLLNTVEAEALRPKGVIDLDDVSELVHQFFVAGLVAR